MNDRGFENAPDMGGDFDNVDHNPRRAEYDARDWEPVEEPELKPSTLHPSLDLTPGGNLEQDVHSEIDESARRAILDAQRGSELDDHPQDVSTEFDEVSGREYEDYTAERDFEAYLNRLENDRAERFAERSDRRGLSHEWER